VRGVPVYRLRNRLLPLVRLREVLGLPREPAGEGAHERAVSIVVLQADGHRFGLVVDEVNDTEEIVVKPLGTQLKGLGVYAGATLRGDGRIALILDVMGVAQRSGVLKDSGTRGAAAAAEEHAPVRRKGTVHETLLLLELGPNQRVAVPLRLVSRLEEIPREKVEREGSFDVVQYRGQIMPLLELGTLLGAPFDAGERALLPVVVHTHDGCSVGLVVGRIVDIVEETYVLDQKMKRHAIRGSAVVAGRVTEFLDIQELIDGVGLVFDAEAVATAE